MPRNPEPDDPSPKDNQHDDTGPGNAGADDAGADADGDADAGEPIGGGDVAPGSRETGARPWAPGTPRWLTRLARETSSRVDDAIRSAETAKLIAEVEDRVWAFRRNRKIGRGTLRSTYVVAYRGFVANQLSSKKAYVRIRVMEEPVLPSTESLPNSQLLRSNIRRFVALAFPGLRVRISIGDFVADTVTDRHGFATAQLPAVDLEPGWTRYECQTMPSDPTEEPVRATGEVLVPDQDARFGVISDVDDTVLRTGMSEGLSAVRNTLLGTAATRRAIPGMAALYGELAGPIEPAIDPAFHYVSTGPWNLYDMLVDFLDIRGFPAGPLYLTDWAPQERFVVRSGQGHKFSTLQRIFEAYPDTKFILFGDSGQKDPEIYVEAARRWPDSVLAVVIREVGDHLPERSDQLRRQAGDLLAEDIHMRLARDAGEAAEFLAALELLEPDSVAAVRRALETDTVV